MLIRNACKDIPFGVFAFAGMRGFPDGRKRVRMRNNAFPMVFVKTATSIRQFVPRLQDGILVCDYKLEQGANYRSPAE